MRIYQTLLALKNPQKLRAYSSSVALRTLDRIDTMQFTCPNQIRLMKCYPSCRVMCPVLRIVQTVLLFMRIQLLVYVSHPLRCVVLSGYRPLDRRVLHSRNSVKYLKDSYFGGNRNRASGVPIMKQDVKNRTGDVRKT